MILGLLICCYFRNFTCILRKRSPDFLVIKNIGYETRVFVCIGYFSLWIHDTVLYFSVAFAAREFTVILTRVDSNINWWKNFSERAPLTYPKSSTYRSSWSSDSEISVNRCNLFCSLFSSKMMDLNAPSNIGAPYYMTGRIICEYNIILIFLGSHDLAPIMLYKHWNVAPTFLINNSICVCFDPSLSCYFGCRFYYHILNF